MQERTKPVVHKLGEYFLREHSVGTIRPLMLHPPGSAAADRKPVPQIRAAYKQPYQNQDQKLGKNHGSTYQTQLCNSTLKYPLFAHKICFLQAVSTKHGRRSV
jgi:hypothetical protein